MKQGRVFGRAVILARWDAFTVAASLIREAGTAMSAANAALMHG